MTAYTHVQMLSHYQVNHPSQHQCHVSMPHSVSLAKKSCQPFLKPLDVTYLETLIGTVKTFFLSPTDADLKGMLGVLS